MVNESSFLNEMLANYLELQVVNSTVVLSYKGIGVNKDANG